MHSTGLADPGLLAIPYDRLIALYVCPGIFSVQEESDHSLQGSENAMAVRISMGCLPMLKFMYFRQPAPALEG